MAFAVLCVVIIFMIMCFDNMGTAKTSGAYQIEFSQGFAGDSATVYMNDSLVYNDLVPSDTTKIRVTPFAEQHVLMVVDSKTDRSMNFNISEKSGRIILRKVDGGMVMVTEQEWENE